MQTQTLEIKRHKKRKMRPYTTLLCPLNGFQVTWCKGACVPLKGRGRCGRIAPHALKGRTQRAIAAYEERKARERAAQGAVR